MSAWWDDLLDVGTEDRVRALLEESGMTRADAELMAAWVSETAACCRLAFAALKTTDAAPILEAPSPQAIISQTQPRPRRGRPSTAEWASLAGYLIHDRLRVRERHFFNYRFIAMLITILLGREVDVQEVKRQFWGMRKEARDRATEGAKVLLEGGLKEKMTEKEFERYFTTVVGEDLPTTAAMPPIVEHGKVRKEWLGKLLATRRAILRRVRRYGPLGGADPVVGIDSRSEVISGLSLGGSPGRSGMIHLGKGKDVPLPRRPFTGSTTSVSIPQSLFSAAPYAVVLYAMPAWRWEWMSMFVLGRTAPRASSYRR